MAADEVGKLQKHLSLLREEYVKLQDRLADVEKRYQTALAASGGRDYNDGFVSRLVRIVSGLYDKDLYSDLVVEVDGRMIKAHKFVLAARGDHWGMPDMSATTRLCLDGVSFDVGALLLKWVYTGRLECKDDSDKQLALLRAAARYRLEELKLGCEQALMSYVTVRNCIRYYQTADEIGAEALKAHCSELISCHWNDFTGDDFASMPAPLLYGMMKSKTDVPLHRAIRAHREDVVFLYIVEHSSKLAVVLNERDSSGCLPLDLALRERQESLASTLLRNGADVNALDPVTGESLLHQAIGRDDDFAAIFLVKNGASVSAITRKEKRSPLHLLSTSSPHRPRAKVMLEVVQHILAVAGACDVNLRDFDGDTALHLALRAGNVDVFDALLLHSGLDLNAVNGQRQTPLWISLLCAAGIGGGSPVLCSETAMGFAERLVNKGCDTDVRSEATGDTLLHQAAALSMDEPARFLCKHSSAVNTVNNLGETPLHIACKVGLVGLVECLLNKGANPNMQTLHAVTAAEPEDKQPSRAVSDRKRKEAVAAAGSSERPPARALAVSRLSADTIELGAGQPWIPGGAAFPLVPSTSVAAAAGTSGSSAGAPSPGARRRGTSSSTTNPFEMDDDDDDGGKVDSRAQAIGAGASMAKSEDTPNRAVAFGHRVDQLAAMAAAAPDDVEPTTAARGGLSGLLQEEEQQQQQRRRLSLSPGRQTPLHIAISNQQDGAIDVIISHKEKLLKLADNGLIIPNFSIRDSLEQTPLAAALWAGMYGVARRLLAAGAGIDGDRTAGDTLLHQAIRRGAVDVCLFLLENRADVKLRSSRDESALELAVNAGLPYVVEALCDRKAELNATDGRGSCPLWSALVSGRYDIASILVKKGCDATMWHTAADGSMQTLLHRALTASNVADEVACFLVRSQCDVNSPRQPGQNGGGGEASRDGQTPMHLAARHGLESVILCLLEHGASVNVQDAGGRTPLHVAIDCSHTSVAALLLSSPKLDLAACDRTGCSPFAAAMARRNNRIAQAILSRYPAAAEQIDNQGRNYLHIAVQKSDIESLLFLISISANVNSRMQDAEQLTPLHLAVSAGAEIVVRNLLLAGANINDLTCRKQTALHLAAARDAATICSLLIENGVDFNACDDQKNNALHVAVFSGSVNACRVLLTECAIPADAVNLKGQNPLHILGQYGKDSAAAIFELFIECMPQYPVNKPDMDGNTCLLLAYVKGNSNLCRAVVRAGASLGSTNHAGVSIFSAPVATRRLLFNLLNLLAAEPPWIDGDTCLECGTKFSIKTRKHHCRHCGRLLCSKCSEKEMPILKFGLGKPVRVCDTCLDVLTFATRGDS